MLNNTDRVRPAAIQFLKTGAYTTALPGTKEYYEHWDEERSRCLYGYTVDKGTNIS